MTSIIEDDHDTGSADHGGAYLGMFSAAGHPFRCRAASIALGRKD
jgi:hypothetical protein